MVKVQSEKIREICVAGTLGLLFAVFCEGRNVHKNVNFEMQNVGEYLINFCFEFVSKSSRHVLDCKSNTHTGRSQIQ